MAGLSTPAMRPRVKMAKAMAAPELPAGDDPIHLALFQEGEGLVHRRISFSAQGDRRRIVHRHDHGVCTISMLDRLLSSGLMTPSSPTSTTSATCSATAASTPLTTARGA